MNKMVVCVVNGESEGGEGYLADGQELTAEEHAFLQSNVGGKGVSLEEEDML